MHASARFEPVTLPFALAGKYPNANRQWIWQFVFPASTRCKDPRSEAIVRFRMHESGLQQAVSEPCARLDSKSESSAIRVAIALRQNGYDIRTIQELLGHKDVKTTMIYTHVLNRGGRGVRSPLDK